MLRHGCTAPWWTLPPDPLRCTTFLLFFVLLLIEVIVVSVHRGAYNTTTFHQGTGGSLQRQLRSIGWRWLSTLSQSSICHGRSARMTRVTTHTNQANERLNQLSLADDVGWQRVKFPRHWKLLQYLYQVGPNSGSFTVVHQQWFILFATSSGNYLLFVIIKAQRYL